MADGAALRRWTSRKEKIATFGQVCLGKARSDAGGLGGLGGLGHLAGSSRVIRTGWLDHVKQCLLPNLFVLAATRTTQSTQAAHVHSKMAALPF